MGKLLSWGRYPNAPQHGHPVAWRDSLAASRQLVCNREGTTLVYGNGRSYGDSCLAASGHVLDLRGLDRMIAADWQAGVLRAESGITLGEILDLAIPRGWMLPVTPGTKYVTLGDAIAKRRTWQESSRTRHLLPKCSTLRTATFRST